MKEEHDRRQKELKEDQTRKREERELLMREKAKRREQERKELKLLSPELKEIRKQKPLYQVKMEQEQERHKSELQLKKERLKQIRDLHQPLDPKVLGEHKDRFEAERKRLQVDYQDARNKKLGDIRKENAEITRTLKELNPEGQDKKMKNVQEELETIKENLKYKFRASPSRQQAAMKDYSEHIKKNYAPKVSQKKKDELERAIRDGTSQFARQTPHLPLEAMTVNDPNHPLSPQFLKQAIKEHQEYFAKNSGKKSLLQDSEVNPLTNDQLGNDQINQSKDIDELPKYQLGYAPTYNYNVDDDKKANPYVNENYEDRYHWKWDTKLNRLMQEQEKPKVGQFHKETVDYIAKRRRKTQSANAMELPLPKALGDKRLSQQEKVDLIREQMKKIEKMKEDQQFRIKAKHLEDQHFLFTEKQKANKAIR